MKDTFYEGGEENTLNSQDIINLGNLTLKMIPEEGEMIEARGGLGNKILHQRKKEDGKYYVRNNENEEWKERPDLLWEDYLKLKKALNI